MSARGARAVALLCTALILVCFVFYIAAQFDAAALAFTDQFGLSTLEAVLLGAAVILTYSLMGGFWAVSVTDTLQGIVMAFVAVGLPLAAVLAAGGPGEVFASLADAPGGYLSPTGGRAAWGFGGFALGIASIGLGTFGQPHLHARLMGLRDEAARRQGFALSMGWAVVVYLGMAALALAGRAMTGGGLADGEVLFYRTASDVLPPVLAGVVIAAILSAVMSTVDSVLLAAAGAVAHDLGYTRRHPARALLISRAVMAGIAALAVVLTLSLPDTIFNRVLFAWSALGAAFGPLVFARIAGGRPGATASLAAIAALAVVLTLSLPDTIFNRVLFAWSALGAAFGPLMFARIAGRRPGTLSSLAAIASGFSVCVLFYLLGAGEGGGWLGDLARLDGDPFERFVPWLPPAAILLAARSRSGSRP